jgi:Nucleotide-diphospho-sugar transferase
MDKLRVHVGLSRGHTAFAATHFRASLPSDLKLVVHPFPRRLEGIEYGTPAFDKGMQWGVRELLKMLAAERKPFLVSDVDVRFYGPVAADLLACLGDRDLAFQDDGAAGVCKGFFAVRPSARTIGFFKRVLARMQTTGEHDQAATNALLREPEPGVTWTLLPPRYWTYGQEGRGEWRQGDAVHPPADLLVHHANWTRGLQSKLDLLDAVRSMKCSAAAKRHMIEKHPLGATVAAQMLVEQERARHALPHHRMPLAIVLQFWEGDARDALALARLLADIELAPREDVLLVFARQDNVLASRELRDTFLYCAAKFPCADLVTRVGGVRYPAAASRAWESACRKLSDCYHDGVWPYHSAFFCEADGCPLSVDWIDRLKRAHAETLALGKRVTGARSYDSEGDRWHINGSLVMHLSLWEDRPSLHRCPNVSGWDGFHGQVMLTEAGPSPIIRNEYGVIGVTEVLFRHCGYDSAWLSSVKDGTHHHWARRILVGGPRQAVKVSLEESAIRGRAR